MMTMNFFIIHIYRHRDPTLRASNLVQTIWDEYRINKRPYYEINKQLINRQKFARMDSLSSLQMKFSGHL